MGFGVTTARFGRRIACWLLPALLALSALPAAAETLRGVALVIGNGRYEHLPPLANPAADARAVESLLDELGFETALASDRNARRLARDLAEFIEEARSADVALVYYAGHGIEAGGENFLVPVDADLSALDAASERLVPLSAFLAELQASVPVAILMLDACRDNPFPPGSAVRLDAAADPVPMAAGGLGETRGAARLSAPAAPVENFGAVIAFAAEPGKVALDGAPGENSPYAAAVLRHFDAMAGEEFGILMRMVAEEVYLKTSGRQRPWVNESLRRLLHFGAAPQVSAGEDEQEILAERRRLLVTIAALPDPQRRGVERAARDGGVPMDALYAMLAALGHEAPRDPAELETLLHGQAVRLKEIIAERGALKSTDPEIVRLAALADEAIAEGALAAAIRLHGRAKARVEELEGTVEDAEADIRARRIEFAQVYARSAEAYTLAFEHLKAADDYALAFGQVERWDDRLALQYRRAELDALTTHGNYSGDNAALERAIETGRQGLRLAERGDDRDARAGLLSSLGNALWTLGHRESGTQRLEEAAETYRAALEDFTRERAPLEWAQVQSDLAATLLMLGQREPGTQRLEEAVAAFHAALEVRTRERAPLDWAQTQNNLGAALKSLGERESGTERLEASVAAFRAALEEYTFERTPIHWASLHNNLGNVLVVLGERENDPARLEEAAAALRTALRELPRAHVPLEWAQAQNNLGNALLMLGQRSDDTQTLEEAVAAYRAALEEFSRADTPLRWAQVHNNLGAALASIGENEDSVDRLEEAVAAYRTALEERVRERVPLDWAATQYNLGSALASLGTIEGDHRLLEEAVVAFRSAIEEQTRERTPLHWALAQDNLGAMLVTLGQWSGRREEVEEGRRSIAAAWEVYQEAGYARYDDYFRSRLADVDDVLETME